MKRYRILSLAVIVVLAAAALTWAGARSSAWLGVYTQAIDADLAEAFALTVDRGAIINEVVEDSPAEEAGLREDDIIVSLDGDRIRDDDDLIDLVTDHDPGDDIKLTVVRDGKETEIEVTLGKRPRSRRWTNGFDFFRTPHAPRAPGAFRAPKAPRVFSYHFDDDDFYFDDEHPYIGVTLLDISRRTARSLGGDDHGVLIDDVEGDSPAESAGLEPGDLIVAIDGEEVSEAADVQDIIRSLDEGDVARIEVVRQREQKTIEVTIELDEDGAYYGGPHILRLPDLPDIDLNIPRMKGLHRSYSHDYDLFDSKDLREAMEEYEEEMAELKKELRELRKALE
jgi:serine protease Do